MSDFARDIGSDESREFAGADNAIQAHRCELATNAITSIRAAAQAGDVAAQVAFGTLLCEGRGVAIDATEGAYWYALAASSGDAQAMNLLGRCHELARGVPMDFELAAAWYRQAAAAGLDWGMYNTALLLFHGRGIGADQAKALEWFRRAAALGHAKSINWVGRFYDEGWVVEADADFAFDCYRRSAQAGDFRGQASYASMLVIRSRVDDAVIWLGRSLAGASMSFRLRLLAELANSRHDALRALAGRVESEVDSIESMR